jgi:hypothetical protein
MIEQLMREDRFNFVNAENKRFICEFTGALEEAGHTFGNAIGSGFCWGKYMIIYTKANVKARKVTARIYMREDGIVLRMFFSGVSKHAAYILNTPEHIRSVFTGSYGDCRRCKGDDCMFRKDYSIGGVQYEKCNSRTFEFPRPDMGRLSEYLALFKEFYPVKKPKA